MKFTGCILTVVCSLLLIQVIAESSTDNLYTSDQNNTYYIETRHKYNWYESWMDCVRRNFTILAIDTPEKSQEIMDLMNTNFKEKDKPLLYIGAHDLAKSRHFVWTATGKEFVYTNWAEFEPNNYENREHCVQIGLYDNSTWNDVDCSLNLGYICEKSVTNGPQLV